jgi:hypothetical protein
MGDVPQRLAALRKEDHLVLDRRVPGPTRPPDLQTNHDRGVGVGTPNPENRWTFVEHIRVGYEPMDNPGREVVQDLLRGQRMTTQCNWKQ